MGVMMDRNLGFMEKLPDSKLLIVDLRFTLPGPGIPRVCPSIRPYLFAPGARYSDFANPIWSDREGWWM